MFAVNDTVFLKNSKATTDHEGGKNPLLFIGGALISDADAVKYGLKEGSKELAKPADSK